MKTAHDDGRACKTHSDKKVYKVYIDAVEDLA